MKSHPAPAISVIVPSRDGDCGGNVARLLADIQAQERAGEAEIILVVGERPNGHARNVGAAIARGTWLVFIDDDAGLVGRRILTELLAPFQGGLPGAPIGMTGVATLLPESANRFQRAQAAAVPRTVSPPVDHVTESDMAHHLCCAVPRRVYQQIGGESDELETGTDVDLRRRLRRAGYRVVVAPRSAATHPPPKSLAVFWKKHLWYGVGKVQLERLHPRAGRQVIRGGRVAVLRFAARALLTFPARLVRFDRSASWGWNPLRALADLAQKLGYAASYWRMLSGLGPRDRFLSSRGLEAYLLRSAVPAASPPVPARVRRVLLVVTAGLGDALTMQPVLRAIREQFPAARFTGWVSRAGAGIVLQRDGLVHEIWRGRLSAATRAGRLFRKAALLVRLRIARFDLAVVNFINSNEETAVLLRLAGIPFRAGYVEGASKASLFSLPVPEGPEGAARHALDRHRDLLPVLGIPPGAAAPPLWRIQDGERSRALNLLKERGGDPDRRAIGMHPGCGSGMAWKRWPAERFAAVAERLGRQGFEIRLFGGPEEVGLVRDIRARSRPGVIDLSGYIGLDLAAALMEPCELLVANDSGLYNLALSIPVPVVVIFGPSSPASSGPWATGSPAITLTHPVGCHPCVDLRRPPTTLACPIQRICLTGVSVERVLEACQAVLAAPHRASPLPTLSQARP